MAQWTIDASLVIPHPTQQSILLLTVDDKYTLPHLQLLASNFHLFQRTCRDQYGAEMTSLRWLSRQENEEIHRLTGIVLIENHTPDWRPPANSKWMDVYSLSEIPLENEEIRPILIRALTDTQEPPERLDWMKRGWFQKARDWMVETLNKQGYTLTGQPEQFKQGAISSLIRTETTSGIVYFKAIIDLPLFCHEPKMMQTLGKLLPDYIPTPIAIDEERRWMLAEDFGVTVVNSNPHDHMLEQMVKNYADLQIKTALMLHTLLDAGCLDRKLNMLSDQIDSIIEDIDFNNALNEEEKMILQNAKPVLQNLCDQLATFNIPYTLVHGDFHHGNVALQAGKTHFFDWTDACISHPFFDLPVFLSYGQENRDALRDIYLTCWLDYEPLERLHEAYKIAEILSALHQTVSYQGIRDGLESSERPDWNGAGLFFIRRILTNELFASLLNTK